MPWKDSWIIPKRVILSEISGVFNEADMRAEDEEAVKMMNDGDAEATAIHWIISVTGFTGGVNINEMRSTAALRHPRLGWTVMVGIKNPLLQMFGTIIAQVFKVRTRQVDTLEDALIFLYEVDSTVPKLTP
jgi:hypothetical protein